MSNVTIAVDVMGGDKGLKATIPGCALTLKHSEDFRLILVGDELSKKSRKKAQASKDRIEILHSEEEVFMDDEPVYALRNKKSHLCVLQLIL